MNGNNLKPKILLSFFAILSLLFGAGKYFSVSKNFDSKNLLSNNKRKVRSLNKDKGNYYVLDGWDWDGLKEDSDNNYVQSLFIKNADNGSDWSDDADLTSFELNESGIINFTSNLSGTNEITIDSNKTWYKSSDDNNWNFTIPFHVSTTSEQNNNKPKTVIGKANYVNLKKLSLTGGDSDTKKVKKIFFGKDLARKAGEDNKYFGETMLLNNLEELSLIDNGIDFSNKDNFAFYNLPAVKKLDISKNKHSISENSTVSLSDREIQLNSLFKKFKNDLEEDDNNASFLTAQNLNEFYMFNIENSVNGVFPRFFTADASGDELTLKNSFKLNKINLRNNAYNDLSDLTDNLRTNFENNGKIKIDEILLGGNNFSGTVDLNESLTEVKQLRLNNNNNLSSLSRANNDFSLNVLKLDRSSSSNRDAGFSFDENFFRKMGMDFKLSMQNTKLNDCFKLKGAKDGQFTKLDLSLSGVNNDDARIELEAKHFKKFGNKTKDPADVLDLNLSGRDGDKITIKFDNYDQMKAFNGFYKGLSDTFKPTDWKKTHYSLRGDDNSYYDFIQDELTNDKLSANDFGSVYFQKHIDAILGSSNAENFRHIDVYNDDKVFIDKLFEDAHYDVDSLKLNEISNAINELGFYNSSNKVTIKELNLDHNEDKVETLKLEDLGLEKLSGLSNFSKLKTLDLTNNELQNINDSLSSPRAFSNEELTDLNISGNKFKSVDIEKQKKLKHLNVNSNKELTDLNLTLIEGKDNLDVVAKGLEKLAKINIRGNEKNVLKDKDGKKSSNGKINEIIFSVKNVKDTAQGETHGSFDFISGKKLSVEFGNNNEFDHFIENFKFYDEDNNVIRPLGDLYIGNEGRDELIDTIITKIHNELPIENSPDKDPNNNDKGKPKGKGGILTLFAVLGITAAVIIFFWLRNRKQNASLKDGEESEEQSSLEEDSQK